MKIFLDDLGHTDRKHWVPEGWRVAINFNEFKALIEEADQKNEKIEAISFDNDLGEGEKEGWEILKWLSENRPELFRKENVELGVHSDNNTAKENMESKIKNWQENVYELVAAKERPDPWAELDKVK